MNIYKDDPLVFYGDRITSTAAMSYLARLSQLADWWTPQVSSLGDMTEFYC